MNSLDLYIVGAGGFARELYSYLAKNDYIYEGYTLKGFLDDDPNALDRFQTQHEVLGALRHGELKSSSILLMGVASCALKKELYQFYRDVDVQFMSYFHPTCVIGQNVVVGEGSIFGPNSVVTTDIQLGRLCTINAQSSIGHDATLGDFCTLSGHCDVTGGAKLGNSVFLGSHACIIPKIIVESDTVIGAGSVVIRNVASGSTMFGNPAKKIK